MTFPIICPACRAAICTFEVGEPPSVLALANHFLQEHGLAPLLAGSLAQSLVFHGYGLVSDEELDVILSAVLGGEATGTG